MGNPPNIRFKGFTDDWEQRKLGDWGDFYYGRSCPKWSVTEDATIPCIRYGELYTKFGAKIDRVYSYTNMPPENLRFSKGTEVLIPRVGEDPMDYNHCTWLSMKDVAIGEMISVFNTDNNPLFTATMFNATLQNEFAMRVEGGSVTNLYFEKLKNIDVSFPSIREQEMIAAYFENIDNLITLHQRKCDETKKLKKFMLQKMFPKKDAKKPEIRFVGFTNDWEQRKVSDVAKIIAGGTPSTKENSYWEPKEIPWLSSGEVHKKYITFTDDMISQIGMNNSSAKMVAKDSVLIALAGQGKTRGTVAINRIPLTTNQSIAAMTFNENFIPEFVFYNLENRYDELRRMSSGDGSRGGLNKQLVGDIEIPYTEKKEQERIGSFFESLDRIITLHQRKSFLYFSRINDWEQRKLGEIVERVTRKNQDLVSELPLTISAQYGLIDQNEFFDKRVASKDVSGYYLIYNGEFAYNKSTSSDAPWGAIKRLDRYENGVLSTLYIVFRIKNEDILNSDFLMNYYDTNNWHKDIQAIAAEGARNHGLLNIAPADFFETELMLPQDIEEQKNIGNYFKSLNNLITLHRRAYYNKKGGLTNVHNDNQQYYAIL